MTIQKKKQSTGRKCSVCNNGKVAEINRLIAKGLSFRAISRRIFGSDEVRCSIGRHSEKCLQLDSQALIASIKTKRAINYHTELSANFEFARKSRDAAEKWLTDPLHPDEFTIVPRSTEIEVVYELFDEDGVPYRVKRSLQEMIDEISENKPEWTVKTVFVKSVDLRDYALKTIDKIDLVLDKFAKVQGLYKKEAENPDKLQLVVKFINNCFSDLEQKAADDPNETFEFTRREVIEIFCLKCDVSPELVAPLVRECLLLED